MKSLKLKASGENVTGLPLAARGMRIGLLGGSFDPPHEAHREISLTALKRLGLDRVWWLVTPGNPLKPASKADFETRLQAARRMARHPRIEVTGFSAGSAYTIDLLSALKRRFPDVNFVWLMGADNLAQVHRWRGWEKIFALMPIAVLDRPGFRMKARAGQAAQRFAPYMVDDSDAGGLPLLLPPAWAILSHKLSSLSSTALRAETAETRVHKKKSKKKRAKKSAQAPAKDVERGAKRDSRDKRKTVKKKSKRH